MSKGEYDDMEDYRSDEEIKADKATGPTQEQRRKSYLTDLLAVTKTEEGVRVICYLLECLEVFEPTWTDKNARLARKAVLSDFGNEMLDDIAIVSEDVHNKIQRTMRVRRKLTDELRV
jgi:hypothetical protein